MQLSLAGMRRALVVEDDPDIVELVSLYLSNEGFAVDSVGDGREAALNWARQWRQRTTPWTFAEIDIPGGTHAADLTNAYRAGLRTLFRQNVSETQSEP